MARVTSIALSALVVGLLAGPAWAETSTRPIAERRIAVEIGGDWSADDWLAPNGTNYSVAGWVSRVGVGMQGEWNGRINARLTGSRTPLFRTDSQEEVMRYGSTLLATWSQSRFQQKRDEGDYQIDLGLGLLGDLQVHQGGNPTARSRDYLDETQVRIGPVLRSDFLWFHPTDPAWRANLTLMGVPRALGITTGNVAYPTGWSEIEAAIGPNFRWESLEIRTGLEGKLWFGGGFVQRAGGAYLQGSWRF